MRGRDAAAPAFQPVLFQECAERRQAELRFPQDAEQRGALLLLHFRQGLYRARGIGFRFAARLGPGAEAEIRQADARRRA